jgi:hypothetical protein
VHRRPFRHVGAGAWEGAKREFGAFRSFDPNDLGTPQ